jgi:hypothetical protein
VKVPLTPQFTGPSGIALAAIGEVTKSEQIRRSAAENERPFWRVEAIACTRFLALDVLEKSGRQSRPQPTAHKFENQGLSFAQEVCNRLSSPSGVSKFPLILSGGEKRKNLAWLDDYMRLAIVSFGTSCCDGDNPLLPDR